MDIIPPKLTPEIWRELSLPHSWEDLDRFLQPLSILDLKQSQIDFASKAYSGLTDLRFGLSQYPIIVTKMQLANVLSASPALRILDATALRIESSEGEFALVALNCLEYLNAAPLHGHHLGHLLSLIAPGPKEISLGIRDGGDETIQQFFNRSNVGTLYVNSENRASKVLGCIALGFLPNLHTLVCKCVIVDNQTLFGLNKGPFRHNTACPKLRKLSLIHCYLHLDDIRHAISILHIQSLSILHCRIYKPEEGQWIAADPQQLKRTFHGVVGSVDLATVDYLIPGCLFDR